MTELDRPRILGGEFADILKFPFVGSLKFLGLFHLCTGSIISHHFFLTAAHCFLMFSSHFFSIHSGLSMFTGFPPINWARQIIPHPNFDKENPNNGNDIGIILTESPFQFGMLREPVPLFETYEKFKEREISVVLGFGVDETGRPSWFLKKADLHVLKKEECNDIFKAFNIELKANQICAGHKNLTQGACFGDSGGPLFVRGRLGGVVSSAFVHVCEKGGKKIKEIPCLECGYPFYPVILTMISPYKDWMDHTIKTLIENLYLNDAWN